MKEDKFLIIHFNNGSKMELSFPTQIKNSTAGVMEAAKRILESDKLTIQTDQQILIVPWTSVKYVEASSMLGAALPFGVIKGARLIEPTESAPA